MMLQGQFLPMRLGSQCRCNIWPFLDFSSAFPLHGMEERKYARNQTDENWGGWRGRLRVSGWTTLPLHCSFWVLDWTWLSAIGAVCLWLLEGSQIGPKDQRVPLLQTVCHQLCHMVMPAVWVSPQPECTFVHFKSMKILVFYTLSVCCCTLHFLLFYFFEDYPEYCSATLNRKWLLLLGWGGVWSSRCGLYVGEVCATVDRTCCAICFVIQVGLWLWRCSLGPMLLCVCCCCKPAGAVLSNPLNHEL